MYNDKVNIHSANIKPPACGTCTHFISCRQIRYKDRDVEYTIDVGYCDMHDPEEDMLSCAIDMVGPREEVKGRWCTHIACVHYDPIFKPDFNKFYRNSEKTFLSAYPNIY